MAECIYCGRGAGTRVEDAPVCHRCHEQATTPASMYAGPRRSCLLCGGWLDDLSQHGKGRCAPSEQPFLTICGQNQSKGAGNG